MVMPVGVGARSARLLRCGTGYLSSTRHVRSFPVVKRSIRTRGSFRPSFLLRENALEQKELPATRTPPKQIDNVEDFLALAKTDKATLSDANRFLWTKRKELEPLPLPERRERAARVGAGRILLWICNHRETVALAGIQGPFAIVLAWFLHAEGLDEFIWDWIVLEVQSMRSLGTTDRGAGRGRGAREARGCHHSLEWCQRFLGGLVEADFSWSVDGSTDAAVRRLLRAVDHFEPQSRYPNTVGLATPGICVEKMVTSSCGKHTCDVALFERLLVEFHKWRDSDIFQLLLRRAHLMLYHPTQADGARWFDTFFDVYNGTNYFAEDHHGKTKRNRKFWALETLRAAYILRIKGDNQKAEYLDLILQKDFPEDWAIRDEILVQSREDTRLQRLTRQP